MAKLVRFTDKQRMQTLAEFRYALRQFLHFSEERAAEAGLHPQQHQLLLHIAGAPDGVETTVSYAAERLGLRHHSVVELSKRCEEAGLIARRHDATDKRFVLLQVTPQGRRVLRALSDDHERELSELVPRLIGSLNLIRKSGMHRVQADSDPGDRGDLK
ncbi:MarR family winged helix-turn-helix transcriptional regulator [Acidicapsa ligni]|uniref:MarR family winged helix-turn-helix transcriptional regulator n=1 Tax=Acidicapsa ligni TaxID=542300 RepID=UPI0021E01A93|nr:MarR family winged helix-turn-helix transcriptional regulator [Acidicapsa ligni]